jgi:hypothetical protein
MAEGHTFLSSVEQLDLSAESTTEVNSTKSNIHGALHFDDTKNQFKWQGTADELKKYVENQLAMPGSWSVKTNGNLHVFKATDTTVTLNWCLSTLTLQVQGPSRQAIVEEMSKAIHIAIGPNDAAATNNMPVTFIIEDEPAEGDAALQASVSQCEGCTILSEEVKELRKTVYSVLRRLDDLSAKSKQNEAALEQKFDDTYDVIKAGHFLTI